MARYDAFTGAGSIFYLDLFHPVFLTALGRSSPPCCDLRSPGAPMDFSNNDRDTLRLVSAFKQIKSRGTRRAVLLLLEELVQKDGVTSNADRKGH
jgi:hypothetical protein